MDEKEEKKRKKKFRSDRFTRYTKMGDGEPHRNARLIFNVGGQRHETFVSTLRAIPGSRLSWISENFQILKHSPAYDAEKDEFFFDRNPTCFEAILNYFRTGQLHYPANICGSVFEFELKFWGIDEAQMVSCCWEGFTQNRDKDAKLTGFKGPLFKDEDSDDDEDEELMRKSHKLRVMIWKFLDNAYSSKAARIHSYLGYMFLFLYIILPILNSMSIIRDLGDIYVRTIKIIEYVLTVYFTIEFLLRLLCCPRKIEFVKDRLNLVDLMSMIPIYLELVINNKAYSDYTDILAIFRIVKVFRLFRYNYTLQVLSNTLQESLPELSLLVFLMLLLATIFAYASYFIEGKRSDTLFKSIPHCLWWSFITMTTVGYGDMSPDSWIGKIIGIMCAICGLLMVALPVSVVATNFSIYYSYAKARISLPPKKKVAVAEHANTFMGQKAITDEKPKKKNKIAPTSETNGAIKNGSVNNTNGVAKGHRSGKLPPITTKGGGKGGGALWFRAIGQLKESGIVKPKKKMDLAALVMVLSSKGEWSAPA